jgi:outer membrane protein OmpA-like peptidoglycan-associated protein
MTPAVDFFGGRHLELPHFSRGRCVTFLRMNNAREEQIHHVHASLQICIVGHTDNVGALASNLKLSADRADAVVKALTAKGVAASHLKPAGSGPYCPVASNSTDEARAKNRRVELVQQ